MVRLVDISGVEYDISCIACAIQSGEVALPVKRITETEHFVAEQDFEYPIEGFVIVASKRHVKSLEELTEDEQKDLISFLVKCRKAMREGLAIEEVTIVQEETSSSSHFHVWLFPWHQYMSEDYKKKISSISEIMAKVKGNTSPEVFQRVESANIKLVDYFSKNNL